MSTRQARIANLQRQIESLDKKFMRLEEDFDSEENDESYERTLRRRRRLAEVLEELRSDRSYDDTTSTNLLLLHLHLLYSSLIKEVTSRMADLSLSDETHISTSGSIKRHDTVNINNKTAKDNLIYFSSSDSELSQDDHFKNSHMSGGLTALSDFDDINYPLDTKEDIENPLHLSAPYYGGRILWELILFFLP